MQNGDDKTVRYSYKDTFFDENIILHDLMVVRAFDSHLVVYVPKLLGKSSTEEDSWRRERA